jgi:multidrug efflux system membrane fusion protein
MRTCRPQHGPVWGFWPFWPADAGHRLFAARPPPEPVRAVKLLTVGAREPSDGPGVRGRGARARGVAAGLSGGGQDHPAPGRGGPAREGRARCWPRSTRRTTSWPRMLAAPRWLSRHHAARSGGGRPFQRLRQAEGPELHQRRRAGAARSHAQGRAGAPWSRPRRSCPAQGNQTSTPAWWPTCRAWSRAWRPRPARWWPPARPWCALRRTARAMWCLPCPKTRWPILAGLRRCRCAPGPAGELARQVREVAASADPVTRTFTVKVPWTPARRRRWAPRCMWCRRRCSSWPGLQCHQAADQRAAPGRAGHGGVGVRPASKTVRSQPVQMATADGNEAVIVPAACSRACRWCHRGACAHAGAESHGFQAKTAPANRRCKRKPATKKVASELLRHPPLLPLAAPRPPGEAP